MKSITIAGRVGNDAELRQTQSGKAVASFTVAVDNGKDASGRKRDATWFKCVLWEKRAEALAPHITKGQFVVVSGEPGVEAYTAKNGEAAAKLVVRVDQFTFGGGGDGQRSEGRQEQRGQQRQEPAKRDNFRDDGDGFGGDDEIPF